MESPPLGVREILGLTADAPRQAWLAVRGGGGLPPSRFGTSSLRVFTPRLGVATWLGRRLLGRSVPVVNLFNRTPTPEAEGWSVRVTQVRDFRGRGLTYDSHNGTDFVVPPGTVVVASAPGRVASRRSEYNRGGLKLYVDHGGGLMTTYHHLGRTLIDVGADVARGQPIALSGYSGLDALVSFPWVAPHVHYNVIHGGVLVDPFAAPGEASLWATGDNAPRPAAAPGGRAAFTRFDPATVAQLEDDLRDDAARERLAAVEDPWRRAWELTIESVTYPTRFRTAQAGRLAAGTAQRQPTIDLPFHAEDFDGIAFADDAGLRA